MLRNWMGGEKIYKSDLGLKKILYWWTEELNLLLLLKKKIENWLDFKG